MTPTFASLLGLGAGFVAALFFCIGTARLGSASLFDLASTFWGYNRALFQALAAQRADYVCGAFLLVISFVAQVAAFYVPARVSVENLVDEAAIALLAVAALALASVIARRTMLRSATAYFEARIAEKEANEKA